MTTINKGIIIMILIFLLKQTHIIFFKELRIDQIRHFLCDKINIFFTYLKSSTSFKD